MIKPVKGSELAEQIELAQREIEQWPEWLRRASRVDCSEDDNAQVPSVNSENERAKL